MVLTEHKWDAVAPQACDWMECSCAIPTQWKDCGVLEDERRRGVFFFFSLLWVEDHTEARSCEQKTLEFLSFCRRSPESSLLLPRRSASTADLTSASSNQRIPPSNQTVSGLKEFHRYPLPPPPPSNELVTTTYIFTLLYFFSGALLVLLRVV